MDVQVRAQEALSRSNLYGLLARLTRAEVDKDLLVEFRHPDVASALQEVGVTLPPGDIDEAELLEELGRQYTYLFLLSLNPHESVQRGEGRLWGDRTIAAQAFMEEVGLSMAGERALLPDHIATQLEVMQVLAHGEAEALLANDEARSTALAELQQRYLSEHLGQWGAEFFGATERLATHGFYQQVAQLGQRFLLTETHA